MVPWSLLTFLWAGRGRDLNMTMGRLAEGTMGVAAETRNQSGN